MVALAGNDGGDWDTLANKQSALERLNIYNLLTGFPNPQ